MKHILIGAAGALALAATGATVRAETGPATCYIELGRLMADPPSGVGELGAAIRQLDTTLRPQVEEINRLKLELETLQRQQQRAMQGQDDTVDLVEVQNETQRVAAALEALQAQLQLDYAAQREAIVGPVQARVGERAQAFASARGCAAMKMARAPDLEALRAAAAQDLTGDFVTWYLAGPSA
ncbi:MAG TPA: hypothetical protein VEB68_03110 [Croceibacterium sp.]|nr:hypothetical protein [Croceibacterium sp.]